MCRWNHLRHQAFTCAGPPSMNLRPAPLSRASQRPRSPSDNSNTASKCCCRNSWSNDRWLLACVPALLSCRGAFAVNIRSMAVQPDSIPSVPLRTTTQISASGICSRTPCKTGVMINASPMCLSLIKRSFTGCSNQSLSAKLRSQMLACRQPLPGRLPLRSFQLIILSR